MRMNYLFKQSYEAAEYEFSAASLAVAAHRALFVEVSIAVISRQALAFQNLAHYKKLYFEEDAFSSYETFVAALSTK